MIKVNDVHKSFGSPAVDILKGISFDIADGEFVSLTGRSGSGKSTLLYIVSSLDNPSKGSVVIDEQEVSSMDLSALHRFRNEHMGFVFQFHYLLPELTSLENILMPARKAKRIDELKPYAEHLMEQFNIADKRHQRPKELSGGQQQRVSIARSLIMQPRYLFADEPTGNLDSMNSEIVIDIFRKINQENNTTIVFVTHDNDFAKLADRQIVLKDGKVI